MRALWHSRPKPPSLCRALESWRPPNLANVRFQTCRVVTPITSPAWRLVTRLLSLPYSDKSARSAFKHNVFNTPGPALRRSRAALRATALLLDVAMFVISDCGKLRSSFIANSFIFTEATRKVIFTEPTWKIPGFSQ